jgi:hypothetical protein
MYNPPKPTGCFKLGSNEARCANQKKHRQDEGGHGYTMNSIHATPSLTDMHSSLLGNLIFLAKKVSGFQPSHFELPYSYSPYQATLSLFLLNTELPRSIITVNYCFFQLKNNENEGI